jgi:hypothetical protein
MKACNSRFRRLTLVYSLLATIGALKSLFLFHCPYTSADTPALGPAFFFWGFASSSSLSLESSDD